MDSTRWAARAPGRAATRAPARGPANGSARGPEDGSARGPEDGSARGPANGSARGAARSASRRAISVALATALAATIATADLGVARGGGGGSAGGSGAASATAPAATGPAPAGASPASNGASAASGAGAASAASVSADAGAAWTAELLGKVDRVTKQVAHLRGLARKHAIARKVVSVDELRQRLAAQTQGDRAAADLAAEAIALKRWGLVPDGADYGAMLVDVLTEQIAGFYDQDARTLFLAARDPKAAAGDDADEEAAWGDMLLAHEIDHALGDQHFDLAKLMKLPDGEGDAAAARRALVEGDAMAVMIEYLLAEKGAAPPWSDPEVAVMLGKTMEANGPAGARLGAAPLWVREDLMFPYRSGLAFVAAIRRRHPWAAVDKAYRRPPRSTEQILHPELWEADERPVPVVATTPAALSDFRTVWTNVWGEEGWSTFLRAHGVGDVMAATAAAGWGGDRVAVYARAGDDAPRHAIGVAFTTWDTDADADEATEALVRAIGAFAGAPADRGADGGRWLDAGRASWVERRGKDVVVVIGAPLPLAPALAAEVWTAWRARR